MNWDNFTIGFWHPFGSHAGESRDRILKRKSEEIKDTGWTLWSFQNRTTENLEKWRLLLPPNNSTTPVYTLCSDGKTKTQPNGQVFYSKFYCTEYGENTQNWDIIPYTIKVPHHFGNQEFATAFIVESVHYPIIRRRPDFTIEWYYTKYMSWSNNKLPTRPEYLIKRGGRAELRTVYAVLQLKYPYIARLGK